MEALHPEVTSFIKAVSQEQGIPDFVIVEVKNNQKGEGYLGEIFMVTVKDKNSSRHLEFVIKAAFLDGKVREQVPIRTSFLNEINFYQHVYPAFEKLQKRHGISTQLIPKCLKVQTEENKEMLALENLKSAGFEGFDKKSFLDHDHVELIFKTYGRLHAYSFAMKDQCLEDYLKIAGKVHKVWSEFLKDGFFAHHLEDISKLVESQLIPGEDDKIIEEFQKYRGRNLVDILENIVFEQYEESIILHGDCWINNVLFRYEDIDEKKKPVDIRLLDWQIMNVGTPVCDLSYSLYSGTSKQVYDNLNHYLKIYHDSLSSFLRQIGSDPEKLFPFSVLLEHWKKYSKFGMIMALCVLRTKLTYDEDILDLRDGTDQGDIAATLAKRKFNEEEFRIKTRELMWHMHNNSAL